MVLTWMMLTWKEIVSLYRSGPFLYFQNAWSFFEVFFLYCSRPPGAVKRH
jgi:hypothetical protein